MIITKAVQNDKHILRQLMTLYLHDLSEFNSDLEINQRNGYLNLMY